MPADHSAVLINSEDGIRSIDEAEYGAIPKIAPPILVRLNLSEERWLHAIEHFGKCRAADLLKIAGWSLL